MNTFHDLFRYTTRPMNGAFPPDRRSELFPDMVSRSRKLHLWAPGQPTSEFGQRLLIGIATWSGYDLNLLDLIEEAVHSPVRIDVFDTNSTPNFDAIREYLPGIEDGMMVPFAGLWNDGQFIESAAGHEAIRLVKRVCNLDDTTVDARLSTVLARK